MKGPPPRTGATALTDDQLILFDALFDVWLRLAALRKEEFAALHLPYEHGLDAPALEATVQALVASGRWRIRRDNRRPHLGPWIALTAAGGALWELERRPDWEQFCVDFSRPEGPKGWMLTIRSPAAAVATRFLEASKACGLYAPIAGRVTRRQVRARMVPWKPPQPRSLPPPAWPARCYFGPSICRRTTSRQGRPCYRMWPTSAGRC